uniref:Transporter n=1 Tax=Bellilinea caldifistulae TaxID=360411 RepID=A0A7C4L325_9CHLR
MAALEKEASLKRGGFATALGALIATLGSAIGLGNIWRFPYLTGENGGAAFLILYLISTFLVGLPVMIAEIMLGRAARANVITTLRRLSPSPRQPWWLIGAAGGLSAFLIMAFYTEVAGWVFAYVFRSLTSNILSTNPEVTTQMFLALVSDPFQSLLWQWIVLVLVGLIITFGVARGIEATTKRLIPLLFLLLLVVDVRALTLPGAVEGLTFLFKPDFSKITATAALIALGLAFFKLSIGMGAMITYGSYWKDDQNIPSTALRVALSDLAVSLLAGIAIFPVVFTYGFEPAAGAKLLFITLPAVFAQMPLGNIFIFIFFLLTSFAAIGAMVSLVEVVVAFLSEQFELPRKSATWLAIGALALVGSTAALSNSTLANFTLFGKTLFDLYDFVTSNVLLPLGGFFITLFVGWSLKPEFVKEQLTNRGQLNNDRVVRLFLILVRYVSPLLVLIVLLDSLNVF